MTDKLPNGVISANDFKYLVAGYQKGIDDAKKKDPNSPDIIAFTEQIDKLNSMTKWDDDAIRNYFNPGKATDAEKNNVGGSFFKVT